MFFSRFIWFVSAIHSTKPTLSLVAPLVWVRLRSRKMLFVGDLLSRESLCEVWRLENRSLRCTLARLFSAHDDRAVIARWFHLYVCRHVFLFLRVSGSSVFRLQAIAA